MKTYTELGTEIGELVEQKNAAYGSSFAKAGAFLALLFPDGLQPDQYVHALLLVRIFDKQMRIATDRDALGESPYADIAGYGILGAHMQWQQKEASSTCKSSANGPDALISSEPKTPASAEKSAKTYSGPGHDAKNERFASPKPNEILEKLDDSTALAAPEPASVSAADLRRKETKKERTVRLRATERGYNLQLLRGENNPAAKLTASQVVQIRKRYVPLIVTHSMLAADFGVSPSLIRQIVRKEVWKHA